jgi:phosphoserine phosphatase
MNVTILHAPTLTPDATDLITRAVPGELEPRAGYYRLHHAALIPADGISALREKLPFDINPLPPNIDVRAIRLLVTDMDSTLINIECIDEIADFAGVKPHVSAITEAAMRGELNFEQSLTQRVKLLTGLDAGVLQRVYDERLRPNPGADSMIASLKAWGIKVALVSGGFTFFTERLRHRLGLDFTRANTLEMHDAHLTGRVVGAIVGAEAKADFLSETCEQLGIQPVQAAAMGDGANDLQMMARAGLSIAYRAKPAVQQRANIVLRYATLDAVRHVLDRD